MKYVGLSFGLSSLLFCYLFFLDEFNNLKEINSYCDQNLVFNHSKIDLSCIYLSLKNLYFTKFNIIEENSCYGHASCKEFYLETLSLCLNDLEKITQNISYFHQDFIDIFYQTVDVKPTMFYSQIDEKNFTITKSNLLLLILSTSFDFSSNFNTYFDNYLTIYDFMNINSGTNSINLFNDKKLVGFNSQKKRKNMSNILNNYNDYAFILELCIFVIFSSIFVFLIYQVNKIELEYIRALIRFNSKSFESYLKSLIELKAKLMNDDDSQSKKKDDENELEKTEENSTNDMNSRNKKRKNSIISESKNENNTPDENKDIFKLHKQKDEEKGNRKTKGNKKGKTIGIKHLKIVGMSRYFKQMNIFFIIKVVTIFFLSFSYFFVLIVLEDNYEDVLLNFDEIINEMEGVYKDGFQNLMLLKNITICEIEFIINKENKSIYYFDLGYPTYTINNKIYTPENISNAKNDLEDPSNIYLNELKLGNSLMTILNDDGIDMTFQEKLNLLYNGDSCQALFKSSDINDTKNYDNCKVFWSAILIKGMEQAMTQMIIEKNSVLDELTALYRRDKDIREIMGKNSSYRRFEFFLLFYFLRAFWETSKIFDEIKNLKINSIKNIYLVITIIYMGITGLLILIVRHVIQKSRKVFNSFLNFIVILPAKFLGDDPYFLEEILKLEEKLY